MKKTLLCFLFLFTTIFYAQVNDIVHCAGNNIFDLSKQKTLLIGNLNPDETAVSYHLSLADASNNTNPIANPSNYTVSGTQTIYARIDHNGTITTSSFEGKVIQALNVTASNDPILCKGSTGPMKISVSGGSGSYRYSINGGNFTVDDYFANLFAGVYTIQVLDIVSGCSTTISHTLTEAPAITATSMVSGQTAFITANGGTPPYQYSTNGGDFQTSNVFPNLSPGNYVFFAKDAHNCAATVSFNILPPLLAVSTIVKELDCIGDGTATILVTGTGGQSPYTYSINGGPYQAGNIFNNLSEGTYFITVKDAANTVSNTNSVVITPRVIVNGVALVTNPTSCSNGLIMVQATSGQAPYYYSIDNGVTFVAQNVFYNLTAGNYYLLIKDSKGCISPTLFNTVQPPLPPLAATAANTALVCAKDKTSITISTAGGQAPYQYSLNNGVYGSNNIYTNLNSGTYYINVRDANNCTYSFQHTIEQPMPIYPDFVIDGQTMGITGQGGTAPYEYSVDQMPFQTNNVFTNLSPGNHTVYLKDAKGCESYLFIAVIQAPVPLTFTVAIRQPDCLSNGTININASGGKAPYLYSLDNGINFQTSTIFNNLTPGVYQVIVKDAANTISNTNTITVVAPLPVNVTAVITKSIDCMANASITASATGGKTPYLYSLDGGINYSSNNTFTFTNVGAGTHQITVKDANGCLSQSTITVAAPPVLIGTAVITKPYSCNGPAAIQAAATGGTPPYQYSINNGAYSALNLFYESTGIHIINIKDAAGCTFTKAIDIAPLSPISSVPLVTKATCSGNPDGSIMVMANGGQAPYTYALDNVFQSSNVFNNLSAGNYVVTIKDNLGCSTRTPVVVGFPEGLEINVTTTNTNCYNSADGTISLSVSGGTGPYVYSLNGGAYQSANTFNGLNAGNYIVDVRDAKGCTASYTAKVAQPDSLATSIAVSTVYFNDGTIGGTITLTTTGGVAPYTYTIKNNDTNVIKVSNKPATVYGGLPSGSYTIITKDANGCQIEKNDLNIKSRTPMTVAIESTPINCTTNNAVITVTPTGGIAPYLYSIDGWNFSPSNTFTVTEAGTYTITVQDSLELMNNYDHIVKLSVPVAVTANLSYYTINGKAEGKISLSSSGGTAPYTYTLKNNITGSIVFENYTSTIFAGLHNASYSIFSKDANGCQSEKKDITVVLPDPILISAVHTPPTCMNNNSDVTVTVTGGTAPYLYSYNLGTTYTASNIVNLDPGNYLIEVKDAAGNTSRINYSIAPYVPLTFNFTKTDINCFGAKDASITAIATGGVAPYTYALDNNSFSPSNVFTNLAAGDYRITIRDAAGCLRNFLTTIVSPNLLVTTASVTTVPDGTSNNGRITVAATGGTVPYTYSLRNFSGIPIIGAQTSNIFAGVAAGNYEVQVTDARGCTAIQSIVVETAPRLLASISVTDITCNATGTIVVTASGGTAPYQYSKDGVNFISSNVFSGLAAGIYSISVRDAAGTSISFETAVRMEAVLSVSVNPTSEINCHGDNGGRISLTIKDGKAPYYVSLDNAPYINFGNSWAGIFENLRAGIHTISVKDTYGCIATGITTITEPAAPLVAAIQVEDQAAAITASGGTAPYKYAISPNLTAFSTNNIFTNLAAGMYQVMVQDKNGCVVTLVISIDPPAPVIDGKENVTVEFTAGQTLADLIVEGQNIKWYSAQNPAAGKTSKMTETPLPLTTVLVNGTTYYASQTINGVESTERLAVTAKIKGSLSTPDFVMRDFTFYPNPVKDILKIDNTAVIDEIEIFSASGSSVLFQKINNLHSEINVSSLSSGFYLLRVKSDGEEKTIKILKK